MIRRCMTTSLAGLKRRVHKTYAERKAKSLKCGFIPTQERKLSIELLIFLSFCATRSEDMSDLQLVVSL